MNESNPKSWWVVLGALLGLTVGNGPIMQFTFGVLIQPLSEAFGADRGTVSTALLAGLVATGLATPLMGRLMDRYGVRRVARPGHGLDRLAGHLACNAGADVWPDRSVCRWPDAHALQQGDRRPV